MSQKKIIKKSTKVGVAQRKKTPVPNASVFSAITKSPFTFTVVICFLFGCVCVFFIFPCMDKATSKNSNALLETGVDESSLKFHPSEMSSDNSRKSASNHIAKSPDTPSVATAKQTCLIPELKNKKEPPLPKLPDMDWSALEAEFKLLDKAKKTGNDNFLVSRMRKAAINFQTGRFNSAYLHIKEVLKNSNLNLSIKRRNDLKSFAKALKTLSESDGIIARHLASRIGSAINWVTRIEKLKGTLLAVSVEKSLIEIEVTNGSVRMKRRILLDDLADKQKYDLLKSSGVNDFTLSLLQIYSCWKRGKKKVAGAKIAKLDNFATVYLEDILNANLQMMDETKARKLFKWLLTMDGVKDCKQNLEFLCMKIEKQVNQPEVMSSLLKLLRNYYAKTALHKLLEKAKKKSTCEVRLSFLKKMKTHVSEY